jgi:hypothetical protein
MEAFVELFAELFSDWAGILSFGVIAFIIVIALFFIVFFMARSGDPKA